MNRRYQKQIHRIQLQTELKRTREEQRKIRNPTTKALKETNQKEIT